ncbi:hypothetical protein [Naasia lichenicola]|uniref:Uncharacterized protein n=1 Tax=Naasia lichenicola TaxID=2565933 RepID=A0A4S4FT49_9MICO|nr:hypothetical protein [Naasia lichenicola]THG32925.1 hypothetical protein E6C64_00690 [Naasia lichenicola]
MIPGSDLRAERRRLVVYLLLVSVVAAVFVAIGIATGKPALVAAAITAWLFAVGRTLLDQHRERVRRRRE